MTGGASIAARPGGPTGSIIIGTSSSARGEHKAGSDIHLRQVVKRYADERTPAVDNVSLEIGPGEFVVLLGSSGSGKTTLLKMVNRLIEPTSGTITIDGAEVHSLPAAQLRRSIGYVIQQAGLFPHMRVRNNIAVVPNLLKWDKERIARRVNELLELVGLPPETYARRYPAQLSGGEQQRVGLARALAVQPATMLMDEPFGALDAITRSRLQGELKRIHRALEHTILFVTHDVDEALRLADRIVVMGEGKIVQVGTPLEIMTRPANDFVSRLIGADDAVRRMSLIPVSAAYDHDVVEPDPLIAISVEASLKDALNVLVANGVDRIAVRTPDNEVIGDLTLAALRAAASGETLTAATPAVAAE
jgi:osmoprotectant transport system ATP-binding protein